VVPEWQTEEQMKNELLGYITAMPKVELHVHLEGAFTPSLSMRLAEQAHVPLRRNKEDLFGFTALADFLEMLDWNCSLVRCRSDARDLAYRFCEYFHGQGIVYAEVITNPTHWANLSLDEQIGGILEGFDLAADENLCDCRLLVSLLRTQSTESAEKTVDWVIAHPHSRLVGLSVDGNEAAAESNERFAPLFHKAKEAGLHRTAHAGESSGSQGVKEALDILGAERIDHGVRAIDDPTLLDRLIREHIPLNVCFSSNLLGGLYTEENHPLKTLYERGISVTINTDDPQILNCHLIDEIGYVATLYDWTVDDLKRLQHNAVDAAFCNREEKVKLHNMIDDYS